MHVVWLIKLTFSAAVYDLNADIIGITESWTNTDITDAEISLPDYVLFRCDRPTNNKGGGVLLYVRSSLNPTFHSTYQIFGACLVQNKHCKEH